MIIPAHHKAFFKTLLRFALVMIVVTLLTGILFQESGKKVHLSEAVPVGAHLEFVLGLALVHGHTFLIGVGLPLTFTWFLHLGQTLGFRPLSPLTLKATSRLFMVGAAGSISLMLLKGYHFVLGVRHGHMDFNQLNLSFMGSSHPLRAAAYGLSHSLMGAGLIIFVVGLWRSMSPESPTRG